MTTVKSRYTFTLDDEQQALLTRIIELKAERDSHPSLSVESIAAQDKIGKLRSDLSIILELQFKELPF